MGNLTARHRQGILTLKYGIWTNNYEIPKSLDADAFESIYQRLTEMGLSLSRDDVPVIVFAACRSRKTISFPVTDHHLDKLQMYISL